MTFVPPEQVPNEKILWKRDLTRGIIHKQVTVQEGITNKRIFQHNVETHQFSQVSMSGNFDVVVSNARPHSQSYGGGLYGGGVYTGSRSGTSRTIGCVDIMKDGVRYIRLSNVIDPQGVKQLINTIKREVKSVAPTKPTRPLTAAQSASQKHPITINLAGLRAAGNLSIKSQDYLEDSSVEQLAEDLANFVKKEFPESNEPGVPYSARGAFWASKGIESTHALRPELRLKVERASTIASDNLAKARAADRSKLEQDLIEECLTWTRQQGSANLTKADVDTFLHGKEGTLPNYNLIRYNYALSRDTIHREVSLRLLPRSSSQIQASTTETATPPVSPAATTIEEASMFCTQCGAKITRDSKFCKECGAKQG